MSPPECDHDWKWVHDWTGDPGVIGGTQDFSYRVCRTCGAEDHETPYEREPLGDDII